MTAYLFDVNVLLAIIDPNHRFHDAAARWFFDSGQRRWLTSPIVENGVIRIATHPKYPSAQSPTRVIEGLRTLTAVGGHEHIPDDVSLLGPDIDPTRLSGSGQVTDTYLALLAHRHGARLATFDRRLSIDALRVPARIHQVAG